MIIAGHNIFDRFQADAETGRKQNTRQNNGGNTFHALMSIWMFFVRRLCRQLDADNHDNAAEYIGCGMHRITNHGAGMRHDTCHQLKQRQDYISDNAHRRHAHSRLFCCLYLLFSLHRKAPFDIKNAEQLLSVPRNMSTVITTRLRRFRRTCSVVVLYAPFVLLVIIAGYAANVKRIFSGYKMVTHIVFTDFTNFSSYFMQTNASGYSAGILLIFDWQKIFPALAAVPHTSAWRSIPNLSAW